MKSAATYIRISKDDENSVSLDYQQTEIERLCVRESLTVTIAECDDGISGKLLSNRPGVQRILQAIDQRAVDVVVVWRSDRLSRDGEDSLRIETLCIRRGVRLLSCTEGELTKDDLDAEFMRFVRAGLNQRERKLISFRTRQALMRKREKGERIGGRPAYGWKVEGGRFVTDPEEQRCISRIVELRDQGCSTREIARALEREGFRTRRGTAFSQTQVVRVLKAA